MKKLLLLTVALALPLAQVARADNNNDNDNNKKHHQAQHAQTNQQSNASQAPSQVRRAPVRVSHPPMQSNFNRRPLPRYETVPQARVQPRHNTTVVKRTPTRNFNRRSYSIARSRVIHQRHDRTWWRNRYPHTTFVLFGGGYYYWNAGYWYPALGYSPIYDTYAYSEPIYAPNSAAPGQVLENVQVALRDQGYYNGAIDGLVGPQTRAALAAYQRDHGLEVTAAVDEPTLVTLGLA